MTSVYNNNWQKQLHPFCMSNLQKTQIVLKRLDNQKNKRNNLGCSYVIGSMSPNITGSTISTPGPISSGIGSGYGGIPPGGSYDNSYW